MSSKPSSNAVTRETLNITITPPVLPLCFANALLTLYAVHEPVDCKLPLLGIYQIFFVSSNIFVCPQFQYRSHV